MPKTMRQEKLPARKKSATQARSQKPAHSPARGGVFVDAPAAAFTAINAGLHLDQRLWAEDIAGSAAHADMLARQNIISAKDNAAIQRGLKQIHAEIAAGRFIWQDALEDVHMNIESRLITLVGEPARRLHTARSRNDQVATDFRLWVKKACTESAEEIRALQHSVLKLAEEHVETLFPGFTHLQIAQPIALAHHLLAYAEMFARDRSRLADAQARMDECPLGAAAMAGTGFPIDRAQTAKALGFARITANSMDSVASRDFALEYLAAASIHITHLSRLAEELILWSSPMFGLITLSDRVTSGSSIMPQKRNPDAAELIRGKTGAVIGALVQLLTIIKALPLTYNKDLQDDKDAVFRAFDQLTLCQRALRAMLENLTVHKERAAELAGAGYSTATDLADYLVARLNLPFRDAHHITGSIVRAAAAAGHTLCDMPLKELQRFCPTLTQDVYRVLTPTASRNSRTSAGGTAPAQIRRALRAARRRCA